MDVLTHNPPDIEVFLVYVGYTHLVEVDGNAKEREKL